MVEGDVESGTIYVLRSKSTRPEIAAIKDLYKIGFTVTTVESRIANARQEPTYLCADVEVVATWKAHNVKSSTFEALIHRLFAAVQSSGHRRRAPPQGVVYRALPHHRAGRNRHNPRGADELRRAIETNCNTKI